MTRFALLILLLATFVVSGQPDDDEPLGVIDDVMLFDMVWEDDSTLVLFTRLGEQITVQVDDAVTDIDRADWDGPALMLSAERVEVDGVRLDLPGETPYFSDISDDRERIAIFTRGPNDDTATVWLFDIPSGEVVATFEPPGEPGVWTPLFLPDGRLLLHGSPWDEPGLPIYIWEPPADPVQVDAPDVAARSQLVTTTDPVLIFTDAEGEAVSVHTIDGDTLSDPLPFEPVPGAFYSAVGSAVLITTCTTDAIPCDVSRAEIIDPFTGDVLATIPPVTGIIDVATLNPAGDRLAVYVPAQTTDIRARGRGGEVRVYALGDPCTVTATGRVNLRRGPDRTFEGLGVMERGETRRVTGQAAGSDGFVWWRLDNDAFVRSDTVTLDGDCDAVPSAADD